MSLIILSSAQVGVGVQSPAQFHNALSNTITIPPNSEVGVVSVKIFRDPATVPTDDPGEVFVRSSTLTHQSYNFNKGLPSKILWGLPRFSNNGALTGCLYYQQVSPIYLSLNNETPMVINDMEIEFVDKDEVPVTDLTEPSVVVLHIRKSRA
jgi:hypothetical protein